MASSPDRKPVLFLILDGFEQEISFEDRSVITFGRSDECDVLLDIPRVSRLHAEIRLEEGNLRLIDKRSSNGTMLNGEPVDFASLRTGDRIEIGSAVIEIREASSSGTSRSSPRKRKPLPKQEETASPPEDRAASTAPEPRPSLVRVGRSPVSQVTDVALMTLLVLVLILIGREYAEGPGTIRPSSRGTVSGEDPATTAQNPGQVSTPLDEGEIELELLEQELAAAEIGWDAIDALRSLARQYPTSRAASTCSDLATALEGMRIASLIEKRESLEEVLAPLVLDGRYGEAASAAVFLSRVEDLDSEKGYWRVRADEIGALARGRFQDVQEQVSALLGIRQPGEALRVIAAARPRFSGIPEYEAVLTELVDGVADVRLRQPPRRISPPVEWAHLLSSARLLLEECRYGELSPILHRAISLDLPTEDHIEALEMLVRAGALETMFTEFLEGASGGEVTVNFSSGSSRVVRATRDGVELEREIAGGKMTDRRPWLRISSVEKAILFRSVPHSLDGVMGLVFLAEVAGDDDGFHRALVNLHRRTAGQELAEAILERSRSGGPVSMGYEEFEGRLITTLEKEQLLEKRRLRKEREQEAIAQAKRLRKSNKIEAVIEYVHLLREQGSFTLADRMLREVVAQSDDAEQSSEARRLLSDPYLAVVPLRDNGVPSNRIDFFILGDGYQVDDQQQEMFLNHARTCEKLLLSVDPYREYEQYFNVSAVHLQSKDMGVTREPGEIIKDTALGCTVRYDVLTSNGGKVFGVLAGFGEAGKDRQTVVIANDAAGVATGGGGVASLPKGALGLVNHEVGHSLGGLHDEYDYEPGQNPDKAPPPARDAIVATRAAPPNLMHGSDRDDVDSQVIWREWIEAEDRWWNGSKVGLFEGGDRKPFHVWRPQVSCMMRDNSGFCVVCMEHMVKEIYRRVRPVDRVDPEPGDLQLSKAAAEEVILKVWTLQPRTHDLEVTWRVLSFGLQKPGEATGAGGRTVVKDQRPGERWRRAQSGVDPTGKTVQAAQLRAKDLEPGWHRVRCSVKDPTRWVLRDDGGLLSQELEWWVEVRP